MKTLINERPAYYIVYGSEAIVYSADNIKIVSCPTEQEATEYIKEFV
jgi:hypothetical protein